jgi:hypothetical protein
MAEDHEARGRALYDHDDDEGRPTGRRRRPVADWGVGEELFDHMPRRRFGREGESHRRRPGDHREEPEIPRGGTDDGRRTIVIGEDAELPEDPLAADAEDVFPDPARRADEEFASREEALRAHGVAPEEASRARGGGALPEDAPRARGVAPERGAAERASRAEEFASRADDAPVGGVEGRRTVKIGGRPGEYERRSRPARTVNERIGARPDRLAAWAVGLGLLLILIAIATASI